MAVQHQSLIPELVRNKVEFIVVGGVAAAVHGSSRLTFDLDVVYARYDENYGRIVNALTPFDPYLRDSPPGLPFTLDVATMKAGLNFTLTTSLGNLDLFGEIAGGGSYEALRPHSEKIHVFGVDCFCLGLEKLIQVKRAAGRAKDLEVISELQSLLDKKNR
jgi:hypothetical protein